MVIGSHPDTANSKYSDSVLGGKCIPVTLQTVINYGILSLI